MANPKKNLIIHNNSVDETSSENNCCMPIEPTCNLYTSIKWIFPPD